jgi:hypothetical protein
MTVLEVPIHTCSQGISREFPAPQQARVPCTPLDILSLDIIPYQVQSREENNYQTTNSLSSRYDE